MKKIALPLLLAFCTFAFFSCSNDDDPAPTIEDDLINGVWQSEEDATGGINTIDFQPEAFIQYDFYLSRNSCIVEVGATGTWVVNEDEIVTSLNGQAITITYTLQGDVLTLTDINGTTRYDRISDQEFVVLQNTWCDQQ